MDFLEQVASRSPGSAGFALDGARATWPYFVNSFEVEAALTEILGGTETAKSDGRLKRKLPKAHPHYPWLYAERISNIQGIGKPALFTDTRTYEVPLITPRLALYKTYLFQVEFVQRPYYVVGDDNIPVAEEVWTDETGTPQTYLHTKEYVRFTDYDVLPDADVVTAQHGQMIFRGGTANGKAFTGMPRVTIAKAVIKFRWFGIPFRYVESANSNLVYYLNRVNQFDFWDWERGSLLYRGFTVLRRYTPVVPESNPVFGTEAFTPDKLCDVELLWEYTDRPIAAEPPAPANDNWIPRGHNLMPNYKDRGFYYVTQATGDQIPLFLSVPFQLLFTDPDV